MSIAPTVKHCRYSLAAFQSMTSSVYSIFFNFISVASSPARPVCPLYKFTALKKNSNGLLRVPPIGFCFFPLVRFSLLRAPSVPHCDDRVKSKPSSKMIRERGKRVDQMGSQEVWSTHVSMAPSRYADEQEDRGIFCFAFFFFSSSSASPPFSFSSDSATSSKHFHTQWTRLVAYIFLSRGFKRIETAMFFFKFL